MAYNAYYSSQSIGTFVLSSLFQTARNARQQMHMIWIHFAGYNYPLNIMKSYIIPILVWKARQGQSMKAIPSNLAKVQWTTSKVQTSHTIHIIAAINLYGCQPYAYFRISFTHWIKNSYIFQYFLTSHHALVWYGCAEMYHHEITLGNIMNHHKSSI